jgi:hypothetical protein
MTKKLQKKLKEDSLESLPTGLDVGAADPYGMVDMGYKRKKKRASVLSELDCGDGRDGCYPII